jgi:Amt family ammonium transporter
MSALILGGLAAFPSYFVILYRSRSRLDDSLDVFAAHGTGGMVGALLTGVFAQAVWGGRDGALFGEPGLVGIQAIAVLAAAVYSGVATLVLLKAIGLIVPLRKPNKEEGMGLDVVLHGEEGYARGEGALLVLADGPGTKGTPTVPVHNASVKSSKEAV